MAGWSGREERPTGSRVDSITSAEAGKARYSSNVRWSTSFGISRRLYWATITGLIVRDIAYSTTTRFASRQRIMPMDGFSFSFFTSRSDEIPDVRHDFAAQSRLPMPFRKREVIEKSPVLDDHRRGRIEILEPLRVVLLVAAQQGPVVILRKGSVQFFCLQPFPEGVDNVEQLFLRIRATVRDQNEVRARCQAQYGWDAFSSWRLENVSRNRPGAAFSSCQLEKSFGRGSLFW